jgi:hypothetical protein
MFSIVETINNNINNGIVKNVKDSVEFVEYIRDKLKDEEYIEINDNVSMRDVISCSKYEFGKYLFVGTKNMYYLEKYMDTNIKSKLLYYWTLIVNDLEGDGMFYIGENNVKIVGVITSNNDFIGYIQNMLSNDRYVYLKDVMSQDIYDTVYYSNGKYLIQYDDIVIYYEKGKGVSRTLGFWCLYKNNIRCDL